MTIRSLSILLIVLPCLLLNACLRAGHDFPILSEPPQTRLEKIRPQVVLVLGSGSARGFAHAGVIKVLEEHHIPIDLIVGTSAGSIVGALYADNPSAAALNTLLMRTERKEVIDFSLMSLGPGLVSGQNLQNFLVKNMKARSFDALAIPFAAVATELDSGRKHVFGSGLVAPAVNASSAIPPIFRPVLLYGKKYVDGALVDPVAVDVAKAFKPKIIIAVSLDAPLEKDLPFTGAGLFLRTMDIMLLNLNKYSAAKADILIRPSFSDVSMFDGSRRGELIHAGESAALRVLPAIKKLLIKHKIRLAGRA